jgi:hypothetical protein
MTTVSFFRLQPEAAVFITPMQDGAGQKAGADEAHECVAVHVTRF